MCISPKVAIKLNPPAPLKVRGALDQAFQSILRNSNDNVERLEQQRLQGFLDQQPVFDDAIGIEQLRYPYHLLQFKQALKTLSSDQTLKISSRSSVLIDDLATACRILKLPVKALRFRKQYFLYVSHVKKASVHPIRQQPTVTATSVDAEQLSGIV
jgi:hypothetical protein